ncbi:MAG: DUF2934 domain-containing protein [Methylobacter sp.]|nr:DUF2934 domain-containing protein [Methylobacter sp.]
MTNTKTPQTSQTNPNNTIDPDKFREMVAECAYCKAEARDFAAGHDMEDWLEAEQEVSSQLKP